ncbi:MAG: hypothetical protein V3T61_08610, partial [Acidobacteriota bacterium]
GGVESIEERGACPSDHVSKNQPVSLRQGHRPSILLEKSRELVDFAFSSKGSIPVLRDILVAGH